MSEVSLINNQFAIDIDSKQKNPFIFKMKFMGMLICFILTTTAAAAAVAGTESAIDGFREEINARMSELEREYEALKRENIELKNNLTRLQTVEMFDCYRDSDFATGGGTEIITFDGCSVDTTEAGNNPSFGIFTATQSGIYRFTFQAYAALGRGSVYLKVDGTPVASSAWYSPGGVDADDEYNMLTINTIQDLVAGQVVTIEAYMTTNASFSATGADI